MSPQTLDLATTETPPSANEEAAPETPSRAVHVEAGVSGPTRSARKPPLKPQTQVQQLVKKNEVLWKVIFSIRQECESDEKIRGKVSAYFTELDARADRLTATASLVNKIRYLQMSKEGATGVDIDGIMLAQAELDFATLQASLIRDFPEEVFFMALAKRLCNVHLSKEVLREVVKQLREVPEFREEHISEHSGAADGGNNSTPDTLVGNPAAASEEANHDTTKNVPAETENEDSGEVSL